MVWWCDGEVVLVVVLVVLVVVVEPRKPAPIN